MLRRKMKTPAITVERARALRQRTTRSEKMLWRRLRNHRFHGLKFRRQVPLGPYIADFFCERFSLVVEIDGDIHWEEKQKRHDRVREEYLKKRRLRILRFGAWRTTQDIDDVLESLWKSIQAFPEYRLPHPDPLPAGEGGVPSS